MELHTGPHLPEGTLVLFPVMTHIPSVGASEGSHQYCPPCTDEKTEAYSILPKITQLETESEFEHRACGLSLIPSGLSANKVAFAELVTSCYSDQNAVRQEQSQFSFFW